MGACQLKSRLRKYTAFRCERFQTQWVIDDGTTKNFSYKTVINKRNPSIVGRAYNIKQVWDIEDYLKITQFRFINRSKQIVGLYGIYQTESSQKDSLFFCNKINNIRIVSQNVRFTLQDLGQITFQNAIYILKNSIKGAKILKQNLSILTLYNSNKIFFNSQNQCKLWYNENIQNHEVDFSAGNLSEKQIINSIMQTVQQKLLYSSESQTYFRQKNNAKLESFDQTLNFLDHFTSKNVCIPTNNKSYVQKQNRHNLNNQILNFGIKKYKKSLSQNKFIKMEDQSHYLQKNRSLRYNKNQKYNQFNNTGLSSRNRIQNRFGPKNQEKAKDQSFLAFKDKQQNVKNNKELVLRKKKLRTDQLKNKYTFQYTQKTINENKVKISQKPSSSSSTHNSSYEVKDSFLTQQICKDSILQGDYQQSRNNSKQMIQINFSKRKQRKINLNNMQNPKKRFCDEIRTKNKILNYNVYPMAISNLENLDKKNIINASKLSLSSANVRTRVFNSDRIQTINKLQINSKQIRMNTQFSQKLNRNHKQYQFSNQISRINLDCKQTKKHSLSNITNRLTKQYSLPIFNKY